MAEPRILIFKFFKTRRESIPTLILVTLFSSSDLSLFLKRDVYIWESPFYEILNLVQTIVLHLRILFHFHTWALTSWNNLIWFVYAVLDLHLFLVNWSVLQIFLLVSVYAAMLVFHSFLFLLSLLDCQHELWILSIAQLFETCIGFVAIKLASRILELLYLLTDKLASRIIYLILHGIFSPSSQSNNGIGGCRSCYHYHLRLFLFNKAADWSAMIL